MWAKGAERQPRLPLPEIAITHFCEHDFGHREFLDFTRPAGQVALRRYETLSVPAKHGETGPTPRKLSLPRQNLVPRTTIPFAVV